LEFKVRRSRRVAKIMSYVRRVLSLVGATAVLRDVAAQSAKNCGKATDHFSDVVIKMNPDPPVEGKPFTVEVSGTLDETVSTGTVNVDLKIGMLSFIHSTAKLSIPFHNDPTPFVKGPIKVNVGPVVLPKVYGTTSIVGQVHVLDSKGEQSLCVDLDVSVGEESSLDEIMSNETAPAVEGGITSCSKPGDHLSNFNLITDHGMMSVTGSMDEALSAFTIDLDLKLEKWFIHYPFKASIGVSVDPPLPQGDFKLAVGPVTGSVSPDPGATIVGQAVTSDGKGEEILCLDINQVVGDSHIVV